MFAHTGITPPAALPLSMLHHSSEPAGRGNMDPARARVGGANASAGVGHADRRYEDDGHLTAAQIATALSAWIGAGGLAFGPRLDSGVALDSDGVYDTMSISNGDLLGSGRASPRGPSFC